MRARITPEMHMQCKVCWFVYDPEEGLPEFGIEPGTPFNDLPEDWTCPECRHPKATSFRQKASDGRCREEAHHQDSSGVADKAAPDAFSALSRAPVPPDKITKQAWKTTQISFFLCQSTVPTSRASR